jgi:diguanylate cyclase (GGDEF)-like protein
MDNRRSARYAISLNALVHPNIGRSWLCAIRDFCDGGMLLVEQGSTRRRNLPGIKQGETVGIHFSVPGVSKDLHFRLEGKIVRVMDSGVGINFAEGMDDDAMTALLNYSNAQPLSGDPGKRHQKKAEGEEGAGKSRNLLGGAEKRGAKGKSLDLGSEEGAGLLKKEDAHKLILGIRKEAARIMPEMNSAFFSHMDEELLKLAGSAKNNAEQSEYFAAMSNLEKAKKAVGRSFTNDILDQIDNPRNLQTLIEERKNAEQERKEKQASRVKLSLVSTDEFEDWLAVANIITRGERVYEKYLTELLARMGMLVDSWGHDEANPIGVAVFAHAFDNAIRQVDLNQEIRQRVYSGFEAKSIPLFRKLYIAVTRLLEESGKFPEIDDDFISPGAIIKADDSSAEEVVEEEPAEEQEEEAEQEAAESEPDDGDLTNEEKADLRQQVSDLRAQLRQRDPSRRRGRGRGGQGAAGAAEPQKPKRSDIGEAISSIYSTVRDLMGRVEDQEFAFEDEDEEEVELVQLDEVQHLLTELQGEVSMTSERLPIRRRIQESATAGGRRRRIPAEALESLGVVENLIDTIESDNMVSGSAKDWVRQLELTLDKVATQDRDFLSDENPHRSLEVINELAKLSGAESGSLKRNVDNIVNDIAENYDSNPAIFDEALEKLKPLVERQNRAFTGNVQRTVKASEGQQTLVNAQRAVVDEMNSMLSGRQVPEVLLKLLMPGWRNLLINTHLRQGAESNDWDKHVQALEQIFQHLEGEDPSSSPDYMPPEELIDHIEQGLDSIAYEPGQRTPLINSLRKYIVEGQDASSIPMVDMPEAAVAKSLGFQEIKDREARRVSLREEHKDDREWSRCLERAEHLHVGEWLEILDSGKDDAISIVAWANEDNTNFVFVNRRGVKTYELMVEELAKRMYEGTARVMDEAEIPLTDRASHRMLQNMHNQLTHQATHDELTGLVNRKEFERELGRVLGLAKRNDSHHLVAYLDLDQFKVVNNAAGHDAGDQLLVTMAKALLEKLPDGKITLARLGGDEFGVLIEDCEKESGISVIRQLSDVVKSQKFEWSDQQYKLTTSCGVFYVDKDTASVAAILAGADAACFAAKDAGRDRIQVYEADDQAMEHRRDVMDFVSKIDKAVAEDRFVLNCQRIQPIDPDSDHEPHYEILLTILDDNDRPMPPQDFIIAAETYNRMGAIDRWVIRNAFKFIANNILKLDDLGPFSINVSGNSLTEDDFMEFVLEQFNETKLPTSKICFEITETSAIGEMDDVIDFMNKLKVIGVQFSLDDFGTGLSSYSYLRSLPVDYLKIDGIFVKDIKSNPNDYAVVKSINEIGHFMGKKTIAEFVEDEEILEILREIGVDFAQGWGIEVKRPVVELLE